MELTMTNNFGFCELNENEMMNIDGGKITWVDYVIGALVCPVWVPAKYLYELGYSNGYNSTK